MDIKKRVKSVKEKLSALGYEVKHTHCQEVLAAANGEKNFHAFKSKEEGDSPLTKALDIILPEKNKEFAMRMGCSSIEDQFEPICRSVKVSLSPEDYKKIMKAYRLIEENLISEFGIQLNPETTIENYHVINKEEDGFDTDFIWLRTTNPDYIFEKNEDFADDVDFEIRVCRYGLQVRGEYLLKNQALSFESEDYIDITHLHSL